MTLEEKALAVIAFLYDKLIEKVSDRNESERKGDMALETKAMNIALFKWVFTRVSTTLFVIAVMTAIVMLWLANDKESAKYLVFALFGVIAGWGGAKAATPKPKDS